MPRQHIKCEIGNTYGRLTVHGQGSKEFSNGMRPICYCECICGTVKEIEPYILRSGRVVSCGCFHKERTSEVSSQLNRSKNYIGMIFNRLLVLEQEVRTKYRPNAKVKIRKEVYCKCQCSCKDKTIVWTAANILMDGKKQSCGCLVKETCSKTGKSGKGKKDSPEIRRNKSKAAIKRVEEGTHNFLIHGKAKENQSERIQAYNTVEYKIWRTSVFERDKYTCQICGEKGGKLNADHIKPWSQYPNLRYDINNGRTLCVECHYQTDTYGGKACRKSNPNKELHP